MTSQRLKRPVLERDRPIRTLSTLFGPPRNGVQTGYAPSEADRRSDGSNGAVPPLGANPSAAGLAEAVEAGYRVVNEYIRQGQSVAQGMSPGAGTGPAQPGVPGDVQQLAQRVMQYGWDFAGLWFEMWTRMGGTATGWPSAAGGPPAARPDAGGGPTPAPAASAEAHLAAPVGISISVVSGGRTSATIEVRPGPAGQLLVQPLRAAEDETPPIREVTVEPAGADGAVTVKVVVPPTQPPGVYNGLVIDSATKRPRGSVSVEVFGDLDR
jgi:hypothetical protein